jgi:N-acetylglucosaminyl-diphospho-decaprenol L-rhamnosyltransferase
MILSVIIINYNVKYFLEQCLSSLKKAIEGVSVSEVSVEVFVVDNASSDGSVEFLRPLFPEFNFIHNTENTGFAKANNQALAISRGELILFLNPDTILAEDSLNLCTGFLMSRPDAGALGVKMIDGAGRYLKESKRGFPDTQTSLYKMTGFARLFPRSKVMAAYYRGDLDEGESHEVDILSGAFMMVKKKVLEITGGFDEQFFMYAEDIDLSYRIVKAGFRNYYLSETTIIHFKGESTRKDFRNARIFYGAMALFIKKHFRGNYSLFRRMTAITGLRLYEGLVYLGLSFRKPGKLSKNEHTIFVKGDPETKIKWQKELTKKNIPFTAVENSGEQEIIFCEGSAFSWKEIIRAIEDKPDQIIYSFHGAGTHSAVSSYSSRAQGNIIEL